MSGTDDSESEQDLLNRLESVLDRREDVPATDKIIKAFEGQKEPVERLDSFAIGFDANVLLRLSGHRRSADILDYLSRHPAPLILPGQAIQEFWNNLQVIDTLAAGIRKQLDGLTAKVEQIDPEVGQFHNDMTALIENFQRDYGYTYDDRTRGSVLRMVQELQRSAICRHVPRSRFAQIAATRKRTKTPPGFKDSFDGDFYVWADFLFGLLSCRSTRSTTFSAVVFLTADKKPDWSSEGTPHPVLSAEVEQLFQVPLMLWDLDSLAKAISDVV